jgi:thymidylate kinase
MLCEDMTQVEVIEDFFREFNRHGIPFVVLRNYEELPYSLGSKDLDLLIRQRDLNKAIEVLRMVSTSHGSDWYLHRSWKSIDAFTFFWTSEKEIEKASLKVDLLINYENKGRLFLSSEEIIENSLQFKDFRVPCLMHEAFIDLLKPLLSGGIIKKKYVPKIKKALEQTPVQFGQLLARHFTSRVAKQIVKFLSADMIKDVERLRKKMDRRSYIIAFLRHPISFSLNFGAHIKNEIKRRISVQNVSIALIGPDGTGKSTIIESLVKMIPLITKSDTSNVHVFHFRPQMLPNIRQVVTLGRMEESYENFTRPHRAIPSGFTASLFRLFYYLVDYIIGYFIRVRPLLSQYKIVIFDRYFYDFIVDPARSRVKLPKFIPMFLMKLVPKPILCVYLDNDVETILQRKQELPPDELSRQLREYRELVAKFPWFYKVDSRKPVENIVRKISIEYIKRIARPVSEVFKDK